MAKWPVFPLFFPLRRKNRQTFATVAGIWVLSLVLNSCSSNDPNLTSHQLSLPEKYPRELNQSEDIKKAQEKKTPSELEFTLVHWWHQLNSPELNQLIDRAIAHNQTLQMSAFQVLQAKARHRQGLAETFPLVTLPATYGIESPAGGLGSLQKHESRDIGRDYQWGVKADWQADPWGERAASITALQERLKQSFYGHFEQQRMLTRDVVTGYIEYLSLNDRVRVARQLETELTAMLAAMRDKLRQGDTTAVEVSLQEALVMRVRASLPTMELRREIVRNQLAEQAGTRPGQLDLSDTGLDALTLPNALPNLPPALILHRPDVRGAESRLLSANADIHVARARLLPDIDLSTQIGYGTRHLSELFQPHSLLMSFVASLTTTMFDAGKKEQEVQFTIAAREEMVEDYVRTVFSALKEVDNAMVKLDQSAKRQAYQDKALQAASQARKLSVNAYSLGAVDYLNLLDVTRTYLKDLDDFYQIQMEHLHGVTELYSALGGGILQRVNVVENPVALAQAQQNQAALIPGRQLAHAELVAEGHWQIALTGTQDYHGVAAYYRDLGKRFPALVNEHRLLAITETKTPREGDHPLFKLYIDAFPSEAQANSGCRTLQKTQIRCAAAHLAGAEQLAALKIIALPFAGTAETFEETIQPSPATPTASTDLAPEENHNYSKQKQAPKLPPPPVKPPEPRWWIVAGSYLDQAPVQELKKKLSVAGYQPEIKTIVIDGEHWSRVLVPGRDSPEATLQRLSEIQEKFNQGGAWILKNH